MQVKRNKIKLDRKYITKALDKESLLKIIASNNPGIVHRIYLLQNDLKKRQTFLEVTNCDRYIINANISTNYAYAGDAKKQAEVIGFMRDLVKKRPEFIINFSIQRREDMKDVFNFKHVTTNLKELVELMDKLELKVHQLCKANTY